jgi:hypothetical protein
MWLVLLQSVPAGPIPASGYVLCFLPLAFVIIGFIAAAMFTDRHARRTYLRFKPGDAAPGVKVNATRLPANASLPSDAKLGDG